MARARILALLAALVLAGCLASEPVAHDAADDGVSQDGLPGDGADTTESGAPADGPEPFDVQEDAVLLEGYPETSWSFRVEKGGTGSIRVGLEPLDGLGPLAGREHCIHTVTKVWRDDSYKAQERNDCAIIGTHVMSGGTISFVDIHYRGESVVHADITFSAGPNAARFVLDATAKYQ